MKSASEKGRYIYRTHGVCPPEIHFHVQEGRLTEVRFVGGGCPGNAELVSRLLKGLPVEEVMELLPGIDCRNDTSCADQLLRALSAAKGGSLSPSQSFDVRQDVKPRKRIALIGELGGRLDVLQRLVADISSKNVETSYCLGNLTGRSAENKDLLEFLRKRDMVAIQGDMDRSYSEGSEPEGFPSMEQKERDYLFTLPQVLSFQVEDRGGIAFFGEYVQALPGYSDFDPFALEINMVCSMTQFFGDETVFPALEAMVPHFKAQIVLFSQPKKWGQWMVGDAHFISVGPGTSGGELCWGLLEGNGDKIHFKTMQVQD